MPETQEWQKIRVRIRQLVPDGFEGPVTDVPDALRRTRKALEDEGVWVRNQWYSNDHPEVDPEDPFCNNWHACLDGVLQMVTIGSTRIETHRPYDQETGRYAPETVETENPPWSIIGSVVDDTLDYDSYEFVGDEPNRDVYRQAQHAILDAANELYPRGAVLAVRRWDDIPSFNDSPVRTRTDIMTVLDRAIETAS